VGCELELSLATKNHFSVTHWHAVMSHAPYYCHGDRRVRVTFKGGSGELAKLNPTGMIPRARRSRSRKIGARVESAEAPHCWAGSSPPGRRRARAFAVTAPPLGCGGPSRGGWRVAGARRSKSGADGSPREGRVCRQATQPQLSGPWHCRNIRRT
jgi:hypothetical protein